jgi:predicted RNase H-like HicB family nuclease
MCYIPFDMAKKKVRKKKILEYTAIFEPEKEGGYSVFVPTLPGCFSQGETFEEAVESIKEAIELYLEDVPRADLELLYTEAISFPVPVKIELNL